MFQYYSLGLGILLGGADKWLQQNLIFPTRYDEYATGATLKATLYENEVKTAWGTRNDCHRAPSMRNSFFL